MDTQTLELRVQNAEKKVEKCKTKLLRLHEQLERLELSGYPHEIRSAQSAFTSATYELNRLELSLETAKERLQKEIKFERFLAEEIPEVIQMFLTKWKDDCFVWYCNHYNGYKSLAKRLKAEADATILEFFKQDPASQHYFNEQGEVIRDMKWLLSTPNTDLDAYLWEKGLSYGQIQKRLRRFAGIMVFAMDKYRDETKRKAFLETELIKDMKAKTLDLMERISEVVGRIVDASFLEISPKGNLDGYIIGENGKAKIETIGAGGYNIHCFHYRTLVHAM